MKRYNKPIPYGWYTVAYSDEVAVGDVKPLKYFGRELVLFRDNNGEAAVLDAYCPHLGAHLGYGGAVDEAGGIRCPFHAWRFDGQGQCLEVPYAKRMPPQVANGPCMHSYPLVERNQSIWVWYHPDNAAPLFEIETVPELHSDEWTKADRYEWVIHSIIQETGENAVDIAHFKYVHQIPEMPVGEVTIEGVRRSTIMHSEAPVMDAEGNVDRSGATEAARLETVSIGPGQTWQRFSRMFDIVMQGMVTPIDDQSLHMRFAFTKPRKQSEENSLYADGFRDEIVRQVQQDIPIWEHKTYQASPVLCDGDGPIARYRKWFQQFYVEAPTAAPRQSAAARG
ncbi:MAG TPA: Rieske 2Fe-2S domain-containing protein [Spongiibacteraceae bacterium]|jgi:phenylpropionate dioxygenase-like ring-hydroxylating dioxygenase large terminal subunit|nr:Rieske 2Fe-2S domain-containing protein [Spongiibacteraceae bacterium]HUH38674.1 Rieske 2Fe-2S domain-containing protein [Spongiibacteraceae bacterium]